VTLSCGPPRVDLHRIDLLRARVRACERLDVSPFSAERGCVAIAARRDSGPAVIGDRTPSDAQ